MSYRQWLSVHRWTGLTLGLIVLVSAMTGAGMAFREELEPLVSQRLAPAGCAVPESLDQVLAAARMVHPKGEIDYLRIDREPRAPIAVRYLNKDTLFIDRCTDQLIASQNRYAGFFGILEWIHRGQWWSGGNYVMGTGATTLLLLLIGIGAYLWWPRRGRRFTDGFRIDPRIKKSPLYDMALHRAVGAWVAVPLAISATTGLPNAIPQLQAAIMGPQEKMPHSTATGSMLPIAAAWERIVRLSPNPRQVLIHVARKPKSPLEIFIIADDAPHANARTYLYLDAHDGHVLRYTPYAQMGRGAKLYYWMLSIHTGEIGGVFGQLILFLGASGALVLGFTGIRTWVRRRMKKAKSRAPAPQSAKASAPLAK